ncbi:MAG: hypothetical protein GYB35_16335, partial [Algicola sp.]|nr:hypothetical protein [Algicola sp.]
MNYFNDTYNIIYPIDYLKNIQSYQFKKAYFTEDIDFLKKIKKDYKLDYFSSVLEKDNYNQSDFILKDNTEYKSCFDYFILSTDILQDNLDTIYLDFLFDFIDFLDTSSDKYELIKKIYFEASVIIFKVKKLKKKRKRIDLVKQKRLIVLLDGMDY